MRWLKKQKVDEISVGDVFEEMTKSGRLLLREILGVVKDAEGNPTGQFQTSKPAPRLCAPPPSGPNRKTRRSQQSPKQVRKMEEARARAIRIEIAKSRLNLPEESPSEVKEATA